MSFAKVILYWRPAIYVKLNTLKTANLATLFVIAWIVTDVCIRIYLHGFNSCKDDTMLLIYQFKFKSELCYSLKNNVTSISSSTVPTNNTMTTILGKEKCFSYPTLRILILGILLLECLKVFLGFFRIVKNYKKKQGQIGQTISSNNEVQLHEDNRVDQSIQLYPEAIQKNKNKIEVSKMSSNIIIVEPVIEEVENQNDPQQIFTISRIRANSDNIINVREVREIEEGPTSSNHLR